MNRLSADPCIPVGIGERDGKAALVHFRQQLGRRRFISLYKRPFRRVTFRHDCHSPSGTSLCCRPCVITSRGSACLLSARAARVPALLVLDAHCVRVHGLFPVTPSRPARCRGNHFCRLGTQNRLFSHCHPMSGHRSASLTSRAPLTRRDPRETSDPDGGAHLR